MSSGDSADTVARFVGARQMQVGEEIPAAPLLRQAGQAGDLALEPLERTRLGVDPVGYLTFEISDPVTDITEGIRQPVIGRGLVAEHA